MSEYIEFPSEYYSLIEHQAEAILLETSRFDKRNYRSYLFLNPVAIVEAYTLEDVRKLIDAVERHSMAGGYAAGYLGYESGYAFETIAPLRTSGLSLARFGLYDRSFIYDHHLGRFVTQTPEDAGYNFSTIPVSVEHQLSNVQLAIDPTEYERAIRQIKSHIRQGDTYQINFTTKYHFTFGGSPLSLYRELKRKQHVAYGAYMQCGSESIISLSPEMFFRHEHGMITTKPMKGTVRRGCTSEEDHILSDWLHSDPKNRSENVMIVDLLRNDIGRIAEPGTVDVSNLCAIERFETLFQMTSTIEAKTRPGISLLELLRSMFPSGSVTGAPKIRSMQIIHGLETEARGIYTGAIGFVGPQREAVFNVAIRTVTLKDGSGEMGVGSGIVYDSVAQDEFAECVLKGKFLTDPFEEFALIETLLWDDGYPFIERHLQRLKSSAEYFDFVFDLDRIRLELNSAKLSKETKSKVRLLLRRDGNVDIASTPINSISTSHRLPVVTISDVRTDSGDKFNYHKTTHRALYDRKYQEAQVRGYSDAIFLNERGEVTEGAISNILIRRGNELLTPAVICGLLDGVYRRHLLETQRGIREAILYRDDLHNADTLYLCNAVRGMWEVSLEPAAAQQGTIDHIPEKFSGKEIV
jgi:para-aminobenzoate synthetase/4-amino-4-deoxychorismate lyase